MRDDLINTLKPSEDIDWDNHPAKSVLLTVWTIVKWTTLGVLVAAGFTLWFIFSIVFAALSEEEYKG